MSIIFISYCICRHQRSVKHIAERVSNTLQKEYQTCVRIMVLFSNNRHEKKSTGHVSESVRHMSDRDTPRYSKCLCFLGATCILQRHSDLLHQKIFSREWPSQCLNLCRLLVINFSEKVTTYKSRYSNRLMNPMADVASLNPRKIITFPSRLYLSAVKYEAW